eukprot:scaffold83396_cov28-Tisochrysis_lutea.AAC.3
MGLAARCAQLCPSVPHRRRFSPCPSIFRSRPRESHRRRTDREVRPRAPAAARPRPVAPAPARLAVCKCAEASVARSCRHALHSRCPRCYQRRS